MKKAYFVTFIAFLILLLIICYPKYEDVDVSENKLAAIQKKLAAAKRNTASLSKFQARVKEAEAQLKLTMHALPEKDEIPSLLEGINSSSQKANVKLIKTHQKKEKKREFYAEIPLSVEILGNTDDIIIFLEMISRLQRLVNCNDLRMDSSLYDHMVNARFIFTTYRFIETPPEAKKKRKKRK